MELPWACCTSRSAAAGGHGQGSGAEGAQSSQVGRRISRKSSDFSAVSGRRSRSPDASLSPEESANLESQEWEIVANDVDAHELRKLHALREAVRDCDDHPACRRRPLSRQAQTLLRFLRAREGNTHRAEVMFRKMLDWRASFMVDEKVELWRGELAEGRTPRSLVLQRYGCHTEMCLDKHGVPVALMRMSVADLAGIVREVGREALLTHSLAFMEKTHEELRSAMFRERRVLRGQIQIIDVGDYREYGPGAWWTRMQQALREGPPVFKVFDDNYPETARKVFLIRLGRLTHGMYRIVRPIVPPRTQRKLRFFGWSAQEWVDELKAELPQTAQLLAFLQEDTPAAFANAEPKGGLVPEGAGTGQGVPPRAKIRHLKGAGSRGWYTWALVVALVFVSLAPQLQSAQGFFSNAGLGQLSGLDPAEPSGDHRWIGDEQPTHHMASPDEHDQ